MAEDGWPELDSTARQHLTEPNSKACVLLSTGALNPPHLGHLKMMEAARSHLEESEGFKVLGGFLSPSHDL